MAITQAYPRLKVEIVVDNIPLEEFDDEDEPASPTTVTKYIESQSGAHYAVKCLLTKPWPGSPILLQCYLDGTWVRGTIMMPKDFTGSTLERLMDGAYHSEKGSLYLRKFRFSELTIDDSGSKPVTDLLMKDLKGVGEIVIKAYYVKNLQQKQSELKRIDIDSRNEIPEKALKGRALSHQSSFLPPVAAGVYNICSYDYIDDQKKPFGVFCFRYRSRVALKSLLIIPRSPSPVPLEERDVETLTAEESRELICRLRERNEAARPIKTEGLKRERDHERSTPANESEADIDEEVSFVSSKRRRLPVTINEDGVETIDLT